MLALKSELYLCFVFITVISLSCVNKSQQPKPEPSPVQNQVAASTSLKLKEIWTAQASKLNRQSKSLPAEKLDIILTLLDKAPEDQVQKEMEELRGNPTAGMDLPDFEHVLLEAFVVRGVRQKNRQMLIYLISAKCPRVVSTSPIELYIAESNLPDPLLILIESYRKSVIEDTRETLLESLSRVCSLVRKAFSDDNDYVSAVEDWYLKNKDHIKSDPWYMQMPYVPERGHWILFVERSSGNSLKRQK